MLPLQDLNPTRRIPFITYLLIAINIAVFLWEQSNPPAELQDLLLQLAIVPARVVENPFSGETLLDFVRSMFFHGGWAHLLGNMLYLFLFGDNIEDRLGRPLYLFVYLLSGFIAAGAQILINPESTVPLVGASGAIAGVLGGYLILFPKARVRGLIFLGLFSRIAELPAFIVLGLWFLLQLFNGVISVGVQTSVSGGVAFFAHVGGFVAGLILTALLAQLVPGRDRR